MSNQNIIIEPLTMEERKAHEAALSASAAELQQDAEYLEYIRLRDERQREFMELMESEEEDESESESEEESEEDEEEEPLISNEELEEHQAQYNNIILGSSEHMEYMNQYGRQESESEESDEEYEEYEAEQYEDAGSTPTEDK